MIEFRSDLQEGPVETFPGQPSEKKAAPHEVEASKISTLGIILYRARSGDKNALKEVRDLFPNSDRQDQDLIDLLTARLKSHGVEQMQRELKMLRGELAAGDGHEPGRAWKINRISELEASITREGLKQVTEAEMAAE